MLRRIFAAFSSADLPFAEVDSMGLQEWLKFLRDLDLIDVHFSALRATTCFVLSRMRQVEFESPKSIYRSDKMNFYDFLEALVRVSTMKVALFPRVLYHPESRSSTPVSRMNTPCACCRHCQHGMSYEIQAQRTREASFCSCGRNLLACLTNLLPITRRYLGPPHGSQWHIVSSVCWSMLSSLSIKLRLATWVHKRRVSCNSADRTLLQREVERICNSFDAH